MTKTVFIDGEAGTTGLQIHARLAGLKDIRVQSIDAEKRKDSAARLAMMRSVDVAILCLPDEAAREAVALADQLGADAPRLIDASTAHRISPDWVYGFAELSKGQRQRIQNAKRVANPGCYATGAIALIRPLVDGGLIAPDAALNINAVSGYSGGGKAMIASYEETGDAPAFELYALTLEHKHLPEIEAHTGLTRRPVFVPSVGNFRQGMLVSVPLHLDVLPGTLTAGAIRQYLDAHYAQSDTVEVVAGEGGDVPGQRLYAETLNGSDRMQLFVFSSPDGKRAVLIARLDNLGKGAAGAAVQNLKLMLEE